MRRALPVVLALSFLASPGFAKDRKPYTPWTEPGTGIEWRGDQRPPTRLENVSRRDRDFVFQVRDFRWDFVEGPDSWTADFGDARVDTSQVTGISLVWYPFFPERIAGHTSLLLHTRPGAIHRIVDEELVPTDSQGVVISLEARMKKGEKYGFKDGVTGKFGVVYSVSTWENYIERCIDVYQGAIHRWQLSIDEAEAREYAYAAMAHALLDHNDETYWLTRNSCSTSVMDMLIKGIRRYQEVSGTKAREEVARGLQEANDATAEAGLGEVEADEAEAQEEPGRLRRAGQWVWKHTKKAARLGHARDLLGLTEEHIQRRFLGGLLVNPYMSFPAKLALVLEHRGLIEDHENPDEILEYQGSAETGTSDPGGPGGEADLPNTDDLIRH